ncbi:MAG: hypothetical protein RSG77_16980 [Hafnia sp.]
MFQILVNVMLNNTTKLVEELNSLGGTFERFEKRKWYFPILKTSYFTCKYKDREKTMTVDEIHNPERNAEMMEWLYESIKIAKADAVA